MTASSLDVIGRESAAATLTIDLTQNGSSSDPVVPDLSYDASMLTLQGAVALDQGVYRLTFRTRSDLALGRYTGTIGFRLCRAAGCGSVYPNTSHTLPYSLAVVLNDWATFQRNAAHTGYVRLTVNPSQIQQIWGVYSDDIEGFTRVAADPQRVYLPVHGSSGVVRHAGVFGLDLRTGEPKWGVGLGETAYVGDAAVAGDKVFLASMVSSSETNPLWALRTTDGSVAHQSTFASQWSYFLAPTLADGDIYTSSGYYGNVAYKHKQSDGALAWQATGSGYMANKIEAPAVDAERVYYYNEYGLDIFRRSDGAKLTSIADPNFANRGYDYRGAPILLPDGTVVAYSGSVLADRLDVYHQIHRPLVRFRPAAGDIAWKTADSYINIPATRGDLLFAAKNSPSRLDAINVNDGGVAWSWTPPDGTNFRSNIVVTDNVLFVSTSQKVYGVQLSDRSVVWSHDKPGDLAIAPHNILLVSELATYSNADSTTPMRSASRLAAFRLTSPAEAALAVGEMRAQAVGHSFPSRKIEMPAVVAGKSL